MADITMCSGEGCPRKSDCYCFTAVVNPFRQSYFLKAPVKADGTCEEFWSNIGLYASSEALRKKEQHGLDKAPNPSLPQSARA